MKKWKSSALAHPIQGLIKYHGLKDEALRLPYQDSISVCTAPFVTRTTIEFSDELEKNQIEIDGETLPENHRAAERVLAVVGALQELAKAPLLFRMKSENNFPSNIGLGASSSGFAALALAASEALGLNLSLKEVSTFGRLGAGSACRAVTGGFSYWVAGDSHESSYSYPLNTSVELSMVIVFVRAYKQTEDAHREAVSSPLFRARLDYARGALQEMVLALEEKDLEKVGWLAERDTLNLHAITMTGDNGVLHWRPQTLQTMLEVQALRREKIPAYFSMDTGATVYVNTPPEFASRVEERLKFLCLETAQTTVGGEARVTEEHLF